MGDRPVRGVPQRSCVQRFHESAIDTIHGKNLMN
jgi:hypothetical protein